MANEEIKGMLYKLSQCTSCNEKKILVRNDKSSFHSKSINSTICVKKWGEMIAICLMAFSIFACSGLKTDVGYVCKKCNDELVTLDGDTFRLQETITPELLIVCDYPEWGGHSYLMQKAHTGYFYLIMESDEITSIDNTKSLVSVNGNEVYNVDTGVQYKLPCSTTFLTYLGEWKDLQAFSTGDTICYSDGKYLAMKGDCYSQQEQTEQRVKLIDGARSISVSLDELYNHKRGKTTTPTSAKRVIKDYHIKPLNEYENEGIGFSVVLDVPEGETKADFAIREWMTDAIKTDVFSLLGYQKDFKARRNPSYDEFLKALDDYGMFWEKLCRSNYQIEDTLNINLNCYISTRLIVETPDYVTYQYFAHIYEGGLHGMPRSYYITYDKERQTILTAANTAKPSKMVQFRKEVMKSLKEWHDGLYNEDSPMEDFMQQAFSFHTPIFDEDMDEIWKSLLVHEYECDEWSGWETAIKEEFSFNNFPLPHFALLPEGIVVTYHPYQIDCFAAGEYHAIVPYNKLNSCLVHSYNELTELLPRLSDFVE